MKYAGMFQVVGEMANVRVMIATLIAIFCLVGTMWGTSMCCRGAQAPPAISEEMPGLYEVASDGGINLSVVDMHRYASSEEEKWILTIGMVIQNGKGEKVSLDPGRAEVIDSTGNHHSPVSTDTLKNPLKKLDLDTGDTSLGSLAFELGDGSKPVLLTWEEISIDIRLDKDVRPPGELYPPGEPIPCGDYIVGIEGVSASEDGRIIKVDYLLKNAGPGAASLEDRDYGRFAVLTDTHGISYSACNYKMLDPAIPPGGSVEGYLAYIVPEDSSPRYIIFWPPEEDAVIFDLSLGTEA